MRFWSRRNKNATLDFDKYRNQGVRFTRNRVEIGGRRLQLGDTVEGGDLIGIVSVQDIAPAAEYYMRLANGECSPQLAAVVFIITNNPRTLDLYFPLINIFNETEIASFYQLVEQIVKHPGFDLQLIGHHRTNITAKLRIDVPHLVAGHLAETFFYRRDILERFLSQPRHIRLYATRRAFEQDGGCAGGDYHPERESIQLVLARLFEGFYDETPGVAPFLHELGHMLDHFDAGTGGMGRSEGLLPGLSPQDGAVFNPRARTLFLKGKRIELERYMTRFRGASKTSDPLPIGHPYVFQSDTEFTAGYFEMFFRNPHYFVDQNPDLYMAYVELFAYDPRLAWQQDFSFYINENRGFYLSGQKPWVPHLTVPEI